MRLCSFETADGVRPGLVIGTGVVDLVEAAVRTGQDSPGTTLRDWVDLDHLPVLAEIAVSADPVIVPLGDVTLAAPYRPRTSVIRVGDPALIPTRGPQGRPVLPYYSKSATTAGGPGARVTWRESQTRRVQAEPQLAVIIGRRASYVGVDEALQHVFGYAACLDLTATDLAHEQGQWDKPSSLDGFMVWGPEIVTRPAVRPQALGVRLWLNDELMIEMSTSDALAHVAEAIAELSTGITLEAGDVLLAGVRATTAHAAVPERWLRDGDALRMDIAGIGALSASVRVER